MDDTAHLRFERPLPHRVTTLAPRVKGEGGDYTGRYGYALELLHSGDVRVFWDDDGEGTLVEDVSPDLLTFFQPRPVEVSQ